MTLMSSMSLMSLTSLMFLMSFSLSLSSSAKVVVLTLSKSPVKIKWDQWMGQKSESQFINVKNNSPRDDASMVRSEVFKSW